MHGLWDADIRANHMRQNNKMTWFAKQMAYFDACRMKTTAKKNFETSAVIETYRLFLILAFVLL